MQNCAPNHLEFVASQRDRFVCRHPTDNKACSLNVNGFRRSKVMIEADLLLQLEGTTCYVIMELKLRVNYKLGKFNISFYFNLFTIF